MSLSSSNQRSGKRKLNLNYLRAVYPRKKICKISLSMTNLPDECLERVYQSLESSADRLSFGLVCRHWLLIRFRNLKCLSLGNCKPAYSDKKLSSVFSWFPRLSSVCLIGTHIADNGLKILAECCVSLEKVSLTNSQNITDTGISCLIQNCSKLKSLTITNCINVTGTGFLGCTKTLTHVDAVGASELTIAGIKAIVSGGGLESLHLSGNAVNNEAVITISQNCPLLKILQLKSCHQVTLEGWTAISLNSNNMKALYVDHCAYLCDLSLQALGDGCNKLSCLSIDCWSKSAYNRFKQQRPDVCLPQVKSFW